jgi:hypothetical protein
MGGYFNRWCTLRAVPRLPASPANVAIFVAESGLPPEILRAELEAVDREHEALDYAPPGKASVVIASFNNEHPVAPPRSWKREHWPRFLSLPHDLQLYVVERETERDRALSRAQNELSLELKRLKEFGHATQTPTAA